MTREQTKSLMPVLVAWSEGGSIQCRSHNGDWVDMDTNTSNFEAPYCEWRVKPKPQDYWLVVAASGLIVEALYQKPLDSGSMGTHIIHVREVVE